MAVSQYQSGGLQIAQRLGQKITPSYLSGPTGATKMGTADYFKQAGLSLPGQLAGAAKPIQDAYMKTRLATYNNTDPTTGLVNASKEDVTAVQNNQNYWLNRNSTNPNFNGQVGGSATMASAGFPQGAAGLPGGGGVPGAGGGTGTMGPGGVQIPPPYPHDPNIPQQQGTHQTNQNFEQTLLDRLAGNTGGPSWEQIVSETYDPMSQLIDQNAKKATDSAIEDLISRGVLTSSTSVRAVSDIALQASREKNAYLGELGLQFNQQKQDAINHALSTYGILEGNKISANATITSANIGAAAQIKAAAHAADATVQAASINAQAMLQRANGDWKLALEMSDREINQTWEQQGIDPERFKGDPAYRDSVLKYFAEQRERDDILRRAWMEQQLAGGAFE